MLAILLSLICKQAMGITGALKKHGEQAISRSIGGSPQRFMWLPRPPIMEQTAAILKRYISIMDMEQIHKKSLLLFTNRMHGKLTTAGIIYIMMK